MRRPLSAAKMAGVAKAAGVMLRGVAKSKAGCRRRLWRPILFNQLHLSGGERNKRNISSAVAWRLKAEIWRGEMASDNHVAWCASAIWRQISDQWLVFGCLLKSVKAYSVILAAAKYSAPAWLAQSAASAG